MSGFTRGGADAMLEGRAASAESAAAFAAADATHARNMQRDAEEHAERLHKKWAAYARGLEDSLKNMVAEASGARIVVHAMLKVMETEMTPIQREQFRQAVVSKARARILEVDQGIQNDPGRSSIAARFKELPENSKLGII